MGSVASSHGVDHDRVGRAALEQKLSLAADTCSMERPGSIGIVGIARNEGDRLLACLDSLSRSGAPIVYVDSGSTDHSVSAARERGAAVLELDLSSRFTAARARNAGYRHLLQLHPGSEFVQFVDGDCEIAGDWLSRAVEFLQKNPEAAAVFGQLRERHPDASVYNHLCAIEWNS